MHTVKVVVTVVIAVVIYWVSYKLLLVIALFVAGTSVATPGEKGKEFRGELAFHRCCAAIQWALMSFYLFIFEELSRQKIGGRAPYIAGILLLATLTNYVFATANVQGILAGPQPKLYATAEEKRNVEYAAFCVGILLAFILYLKYWLRVEF